MVDLRLMTSNMFLLDMREMDEGGLLDRFASQREALGDSGEESFEASVDERKGAAGGEEGLMAKALFSGEREVKAVSVEKEQT